MDALTADRLTEEQISEITLHAFDETALRIERVNGSFNGLIYRITFAGKTVMLKVAPSDKAKLMRFENNGVKSEAAFLKYITDLNISVVPKLLYKDTSKRILNRMYYFTEVLPGVTLCDIYPRLSRQQRSEVYSQLGIHFHKINQIRAKTFGSLAEASHRFHSWSEMFASMIIMMIDDAKKSSTSFDTPFNEIPGKFLRHKDLLEEVTEPSLVILKTDPANALIDPVSKDVSAIFDLENPIFGDTLLQPVALLLDDNKNFSDCYTNGLGYSINEAKRIALYRIFLGMTFITKSHICKTGDMSLEKNGVMLLKSGLEYYRLLFEHDF